MQKEVGSVQGRTEPTGRFGDRTAILALEGLRRVYRQGPREIAVLAGAGTVIRPGEAVALVGPSGVGKSSLVNALAGDEVMATAMLDRLLHNAHMLSVRGSSYRLRDLEKRLS